MHFFELLPLSSLVWCRKRHIRKNLDGEYDDFTKPNASSNFNNSEYLWRYIKYCQ